MQTRQVTSSGGVIFRHINEEVQVALILTGNRWSLPKGLIEAHETTEEAALREVAEETGLKGELVGKIGEISYSFVRDVNYYKTVHFYLIKHVGGSLNNHDWEVEKVQWFPISEATRIVAYPGERKILEKAERMFKIL
jgi:8-oxo-dGTP pyrophosphatase MutT (NUDIX family)